MASSLSSSPRSYSGVIPLPRADLASSPAVPSTTSRLQSASTSTPLSPLGTALTSFLSASPSLSASAPGVAGLSASQSTLRRRLSSPALASSLSSSPRSYSGVIPLPRADLASGPAVPSTTSRLRSASSPAQSSTTSTLLSPLGPALTSFLSASPSLSASAPGVAELSASQSTLRRRLSSPALASSLSSGPRS